MTRQRVGLAVLVLLVCAGAAVGWYGLQAPLAARRELVGQLSASTPQLRAFDAIRQQAAVERGQARAAGALIDEALQRARERGEVDSLKELKRCLADPECHKPVDPLLEGAGAGYRVAVAEAWRRTDQAEREAQDLLLVALGLMAAGLVAGALALGGRAKAAAPQAPTAPPEALEALFRERLEALYSARAQLRDDEKFAGIGQVSAGLSHALKTPLARILAAAQLGLVQAKGSPVAAALEEICRETNALTDQVQRLLKSVETPVIARVPLRRVLEAVRRAAAPGAVTVSLQGEPAVEADEALLELALRNLVDNAVAVTPKGQAVELRVEPLDGGRRLAVQVDDRGPGWPAAARQQLTGVTTRPSGSGMGLAISRRIVERLGGTLALDDRPGGGARATVVLAAAAEAG